MPNLSRTDVAYLEELLTEARGDYARTPMRIPPGAREFLLDRLALDRHVRDAERRYLAELRERKRTALDRLRDLWRTARTAQIVVKG